MPSSIENMKVPELKDMAKTLNIKGAYKLKKLELIAAIKNAQDGYAESTTTASKNKSLNQSSLDIENMKVPELKDMAKTLNIKGAYKLKKLELITAIKNAQDGCAKSTTTYTRDQLNAMKLTDIKEILKTSGAKGISGKNKNDLINYYLSDDCDPDNKIFCNDPSKACNLINKKCFPKSDISKSLKIIDFEGHSIMGSNKAIKIFLDAYSKPSPPRPASPPPRPASPPPRPSPTSSAPLQGMSKKELLDFLEKKGVNIKSLQIENKETLAILAQQETCNIDNVCPDGKSCLLDKNICLPQDMVDKKKLHKVVINGSAFVGNKRSMDILKKNIRKFQMEDEERTQKIFEENEVRAPPSPSPNQFPSPPSPSPNQFPSPLRKKTQSPIPNQFPPPFSPRRRTPSPSPNRAPFPTPPRRRTPSPIPPPLRRRPFEEAQMGEIGEEIVIIPGEEDLNEEIENIMRLPERNIEMEVEENDENIFIPPIPIPEEEEESDYYEKVREEDEIDFAGKELEDVLEEIEENDNDENRLKNINELDRQVLKCIGLYS